MTQLMGRPILDLPSELSSRSVLADLLAGVRTALLGLAAVAVPILGLWVVTPYADDTASGAARLAGTVWLLGHGGPLGRGGSGAPVTVTPLLLTVLTAWQLHRAGRRAAGPGRTGRRVAGGGPAARPAAHGGGGRGGAVAVGAGYLMVVTGVALLSASGETVGAAGAAGAAFRARVLPDVLAAALLVWLAVGAGVRSARPYGGARGHGRPVPGRVPSWAWPAARVAAAAAVRRAALAGVLGLVAAGALLVATAAVLDGLVGGRPVPPAGGGVAGVLGLLLLCVVLLPNAVVWGAAYALGPGFVVGTGAVVAPSGALLGPVPAVPLFELLPTSGEGGWRWLVCLLPLLAGLTPAVLLGRAAAGRGGPAGLPPWGGEDIGGPDEADESAGGVDEDGEGEEPGEDGDGGRVTGPALAAVWHPVATAAVALAAALVVAVVVAVCGWLAGGALGTGRMAQLGPVPWRTGTAAAGWFAGVGVPGALLVRAWLVRGQAAAGLPEAGAGSEGLPSPRLRWAPSAWAGLSRAWAPDGPRRPLGPRWPMADAASGAGSGAGSPAGSAAAPGVLAARARAAAYGLVLRCGPRARP
ncbi:hypothetical protein GCM10010495_24220 [Kitasatospora herbaricolor]|uniref:cell division protein PerM n=1 Tax=Kitasatospora herbaricolor TaxID=68217 RepID=UPI0017482E3E|nr:DUF6350 family protein [Kitasatospora herbaricolor]MDQ0308795.1 hypothetical protein [Kitasatospora herbaricolor]GGV10168.1 hypothetical protein GCM10010495_24220 [Kitasatospora herbaricolor]